MSKKTKYIDLPWEMGERVFNLLPSPAQLVKRESTAKITLEITQQSLQFFKAEAKKAHVPYQRMMRSLLDAYVNECRTNRI